MVFGARVVLTLVVAVVGGACTSTGSPLDPGGCTSGVACGGGCCANAAEVCAKDSTGNVGCVPSCNSRGDCASGCCAPLTDDQGNVVGPFVCQQSNACCYVHVCPGTSCCVADTQGNQFCAEPCQSQTECGGASVCEALDFSHTTCAGPKACGP